MGIKKTKPEHIFNYTSGKSFQVRLRGKKLANGFISLYLDYYKGYTKTENIEDTSETKNKIKTFRQVEYLKIYLVHNPRTPEERIKNDENLSLALNIRNNRESELMHKDAGLVAPFKKKTNFFDFCEAFYNNYQKKDKRMIKLAKSEFEAFTKTNYLKPQQIDAKLIMDFRDHLLNKFNGETPNSVFARFKKILTAATNNGLFNVNPGEKIVCKVPDGIPKEIL